jgi:O-antigen/teichoic acid export membrane protein
MERASLPSVTSQDPGVEMARGTLLSLLALLVSNLRGVFPLLVAWSLGRRGLGLYALAWSVTNLASKVGTFGLDQTTTTWVARDLTAGGQVLRVAVQWGVLLSAAGAGLGVAVLWAAPPLTASNPSLVGPLALMLCALPGIALYRIANGVSRGARQPQHDIFSRGLAESLATIAAFLLALAAGAGMLAPPLAVVVGTGTGGLVAYGLARRSVQRGAPEHATRGLIRFSTPVAAWSLMNLFSAQLDVLLLGAFAGKVITLEGLGAYCAAVELSQALRKTRQVFDPAFMPVAAEHASRKDAPALYAAAARTTRWLLSIQLPVLALFLCAGGALLSVYGRGFRQAVIFLAILGLAQATNAFVGLAETVILAVRPRLILWNCVLITASQVVLALVLIARWGFLGAALSVLFANAAQGVLQYAQLHQEYGWSWPWSAGRRPVVAFVAALLAGGLTRVLVPGLAGELLAGAGSLAAYALSWWWQGGVLESDRAVLWTVLARRRAA